MNYQQLIRQYSGTRTGSDKPAPYGCGSFPGIMTYQPPPATSPSHAPKFASAGNSDTKGRQSRTKVTRKRKRKKTPSRNDKKGKSKKRSKAGRKKPKKGETKAKSKAVKAKRRRKVSRKTVKRVLDSLS